MTIFTSYDDDGRIISTGRALNPEEQVSETGGVFIGAIFDGDQFYFLAGVPTARPDAPACEFSAASVVADGETTIMLSGVPAGATVRLGEATIIADGDPIELSTDLIGENKVIVSNFPAKEWSGLFYGTAS